MATSTHATPSVPVTQVVPSHTFNLADSPYAQHVEGAATLAFPNPLRVSHYETYYNAIRPQKGEVLGDELDIDMRMYRAAYAISELDTSLPRSDYDPTSDELNVSLMSWVNECTESYLGAQIRVETQAVKRWREGCPHDSFGFDLSTFTDILPHLLAYEGGVVFPKVLQVKQLRACRKAKADILKQPISYDGSPMASFRNSSFWADLNAALWLLKNLKIAPKAAVAGEKPQPLSVTAQSLSNLPLVVATFLIEVSEIYQVKRTNPKK